MAGETSLSSTALVDEVKVPKTLVECLEWDDPCEALALLGQASETKAQSLAKGLEQQFGQLEFELPEILSSLPNKQDLDSHPVATTMASADSILNCLTKIASGGSQASQEIKHLESEKRELEEHAQDVETALILRRASDMAAQSLSASRYPQAAQAIAEYSQILQLERLTPRAQQYAGQYTVTQLESTQKALRSTLLEQYQTAVESNNVQELGQLTPLVQKVQLEPEAVQMYLRFLKGLLGSELEKAAAATPQDKQKTPPPYVPMARVYNSAVKVLRHHLPMVSHCLYRADGDAAVVQLIHIQVEKAVQPLFQAYIKSRQLGTCANNSQRIYGVLEERYSSGMLNDGDDEERDDAGFSQEVGSLADVDRAMEEAALCLQHAESYTRFINHTCSEVNKARALRHQKEMDEKRSERERKEWATGMSSKPTVVEEEEEELKSLDILPAPTQLHQIVSEVGGYYSVIERCLLLASMQRAFGFPDDDPRHYTPLGQQAHSPGVGSRAVQTSIVETCLYAARRGTQRAFATGHTGTASAVANFCADCLRGVLVEVLSRRAEDLGVSLLKPGEGLIAGAAGIFNATNLIRQGQTVTHAVGGGKIDEAEERQHIEQETSWACAALNDLEVAAHHTQELERILTEAVQKGFPPNTHDTEQLMMCVKSFSPVTEVFKMASSNAVDSLVSVLKARIRNIVSEAVGADGSSAAAFSVMGGGKGTDRHTIRMNYNLDEEAYQLLEVSASYISRLCTGIDELVTPLRLHLAPSLSDKLMLGVVDTVAKRLEASFKKVRSKHNLDKFCRPCLLEKPKRSNLDSFIFSVNLHHLVPLVWIQTCVTF